MITNISIKNNHSIVTPSSSISKKRKGILTQYIEFCDTQASLDTFWYLLALLFLGAALMPVAIYYTLPFAWYLPFVGASILLLFTNILLVISEQSIRWIITAFLVAVLFNILVPVLSIILV